MLSCGTIPPVLSSTTPHGDAGGAGAGHGEATQSLMIGPVQKMVLLRAEKGPGVTRIAGTAKQCSRRCAIIYVSKASLSAPKGPGGFAGGIGDRRVRQSERSRAFGDAEEPELHGKNHRTRGTDTCLKRPASEGRSSNSGTETCPGRSLTRSARGSGTCMVKPRSGNARVNE